VVITLSMGGRLRSYHLSSWMWRGCCCLSFERGKKKQNSRLRLAAATTGAAPCSQLRLRPVLASCPHAAWHEPRVDCRQKLKRDLEWTKWRGKFGAVGPEWIPAPGCGLQTKKSPARRSFPVQQTRPRSGALGTLHPPLGACISAIFVPAVYPLPWNWDKRGLTGD
jgi:hypothetical protein